ncbi:MAG: hypothetical protein NTY77_14930 [Elusimicrobia bacterium]|nr:hypothetical protein [Elusimicrobiota bacterium]
MLSGDERRRLISGIRAAIAVPFVDDIEDYIWEAIFAYAYNLPLIDPLTNTRAKLLFDVVHSKKKIGWSCKALQWPITPGGEFELVIQRADIFKKACALGFGTLDTNSSCAVLGRAVLKHWHSKVHSDAATQGVRNKRIAVLLKSDDRTKYAIYEDLLVEYAPTDLEWSWTNQSKAGLQGRRKKDNFCVYRWHPNQKQFFERFRLPANAPVIEIKPQRLPLKMVVDLLVSRLQDT